MNRRQFFFTAGAGALTAAHAATTGQNKRARLAVSSWSFHTLFTKTRDENAPKLDKPLDILDFPEMIADRYHIHNLEIVVPHFASTEPSYIREFRTRLEKAHSKLINIPVDIDWLWDKPGLSAADPKEREKAIAAYSPWIGLARDLGARSVRCDPGKINPADLAPTIASYKTLAAEGKSKGIYVIVENHGGVGSEHPEELTKILQAAGSYAGTLPDFANFPDQATRERGLKMLFPFAKTLCHCRDIAPDATGKEAKFDLAACVKISKNAGYKGLYSVEFEGSEDP
ncbi:MAG TPA: TIM barrel protein, partial [Bryobacteraceae bacterium]|nr:TIM barrel protein [Bryobacteraceae bacterium]